MSVATRVLVLLAVYGLVFSVAWFDRRRLDRAERRTFWVLFVAWSVSVPLINYGGYRLGLVGPMPWLNNLLHGVVWVGVVLTYLFLAVRHLHIAVQFMAFAFFSLVVRYVEYRLFGVWEHPHFLHVFRGTEASLLGWSFVDGFIPLLDLGLLALLRGRVPGLVTREGVRATEPGRPAGGGSGSAGGSVPPSS